MDKPKISIIIPIYNVEKYLSRCMDSILNQTLKDIEIIMVDDESPDKCPSMCDEYARQDSRVKVIHKKNGGLGFARNSGLEIASGEFVSFVDSDDYVALNMYETLYSQAKKSNLDTLFCVYQNVENNITKKNKETKIGNIEIFDTRQKIQNFLLDMIGTEPNYSVDRKYEMSTCCAIYSRNTIENNNIRFCSEKQFISEDIIFHIDYLQKVSKIGLLREAFYYYCHDISVSSLTKTFREDRFERYIILYKEICVRFPFGGVTNRAQRLLIGYTRSLVFMLSDYEITFQKKTEILKKICYDTIWDEINNEYDYSRLPFYQKLVLYLILKKQIYPLLFLSSLKNIF
nr:glycosyltransferase [uncultured Flavobacterium sp.]